ncbi:OmpH family outer membrane protein [Oceanibacterium hippocampi]|uniref:Outer membrane protein (OmpH-like) n=1 Tax=Oceanibacterium hippocampi TaxID=745714 RepID=A0A1Y5T764_9PROT|nr:OmpH family outer membrane protein [Oceanibacterium hippocampi]SLN54083.1 Outer membrane protein (OmpH-like) [Oceanibacterium hippocampi]
MLTHIARTLVAGLALVTMASTATAVEKTDDAIIAILDFDAVLRDSTAVNGAKEQINAMRATIEGEMAKQEDALRAEEEELRRQQAILAPAAFNEKKTAFQAKVNGIRQKLQERVRRLDQRRAQIQVQIRKEAIAILDQLMPEVGANIVLHRSQIIYATTELDITPVVTKRLNERWPSVKVPPLEEN